MSLCCVECFRDPRLREFVLQRGDRGSCTFCGADGVQCVVPGELYKHFDKLLAYYEPATGDAAASDRGAFRPPPPPGLGRYPWGDLRIEFLSPIGQEPARDPHEAPLLDRLRRDWRLFSDRLDEDTQARLLEEIINSRKGGGEPIDPRSPWTYAAKVRDRVPLDGRWRAFADQLKSKRRFIPDTADPSVTDIPATIQQALHLVDRPLPEGQEAYRARRGSVMGEVRGLGGPAWWEWGPQPYPPDEMGAAPPDRTLAGGRINPPGISFLYLSLDRETAVAEVRPPKGDLVSVARFVTLEVLRVADLTRIEPLDSPFGRDDLVWEVESRRLLDFLSSELAQPVDPDKAGIDYVPTQYAAEVISDAGYDGIVYSSALGEASNLVLFRPASARATGSELVEVTDVAYEIRTPASAAWGSLMRRWFDGE